VALLAAAAVTAGVAVGGVVVTHGHPFGRSPQKAVKGAPSASSAAAPVRFSLTSTIPPKPGPKGLPDFRQSGFELRSLPFAERPYARDAVENFYCKGPSDEQGVRVSERKSAAGQHPVVQAQCGLELLGFYEATKDKRYLRRAIAHGRRLVDTHVDSRGAWWFAYPFDFKLFGQADLTLKAPWYSGMAQGQVLSLFSRLEHYTRDRAWRRAADATFVSFLLPPSATDPWVTFARDGWLWLAEYAQWPLERTQRVLNGHLFAMFGLYDYARLSGDRRAVTLFDGSATTLAAHVPVAFRRPGWMSWYTLDRRVTSPKYHGIHVDQLRDVAAMTGELSFLHAADELNRDYPPPAVTGTARLVAGRRTGFTFTPNGIATNRKQVTLPRTVEVEVDKRQRVFRRGVYLHVTSGELAGLWVREGPRSAVLLGRHLDVLYPKGRVVVLKPGRQAGVALDARGRTASRKAVTLPATTRVRITRQALVNGWTSVLVEKGPLAGRWVALGHRAALE
jgi:hypothetical protein